MNPGISLRSTLVLLAGMLAAVLAASAQVHIGPNLLLGGSGSVSAGYDADSGTEGSAHSLAISGETDINGYYYTPKFLSYQVTGAYNRSQTNSDSASLTNTSGASGTVTLFGGSKTPGSITYYLDHNKSGTFGLSDSSGLTTVGNGHGVSISWTILHGGLPPLTISFNDGSSTNSVIGTAGQSSSNSKSLMLGTQYKLWGFGLNATYSLQSTSSSIDEVLSSSQENVGSKSLTSNFTLNAGHRLPMRGTFMAAFTHMNYTDKTVSSAETTSGNASTLSAAASVHPSTRFSLSGDAEYTNNVEGGLEQEVINSTGQVVPLTTNSSSGEHFGTTAFLNLQHEIYVTGYANYSNQSFAGTNYQTTNYGASSNYTFQHYFLSGLSVNGGIVDTATQQGNSGASFVGNVNYARYWGRWRMGGGWHYIQNVETLLNVSTTSSLSYDASAQRKFAHHRILDFHFTGGHTGFTDVKGYLNHSENYSAYYFMGLFNVSGTYSKSYGQSILTSSGLVSVPVQLPSGAISDLVSYGGSGYGFGVGTLLFKRLSLSAGYNVSNSATSGQSVNSIFNNSNENVRLHYRLRRIILDAGYSRMTQDAQSSLKTHTTLNSYFIGISRSFNLF